MSDPIKNFRVSGTCVASKDLRIELFTSAGVSRGKSIICGDSNGKYDFDLANLSGDWVVGDVIVIIQRGGAKIGGSTGTITSADGGSKTINISSSTINFPSVSL